MAVVLVDSNVWLRLADATSPFRSIADLAMQRLADERHHLVSTSQTLIEFWTVATRPVNVNGLGWVPERCFTEITRIRENFPFLNDRMDAFDAWLALVRQCDIKGKKTHDARLAALMSLYGIKHILTFNVSDFDGFPSITALNPADVASGNVTL